MLYLRNDEKINPGDTNPRVKFKSLVVKHDVRMSCDVMSGCIGGREKDHVSTRRR